MNTKQHSRGNRKSPFLSGLMLILIGILLPFLLVSCKPAKPSDPVAIVKASYDRLNAGDVDGYMEYISDDALQEDGSGRFEGAEAIRADAELNVVPAKVRIELSDLSLNGNAVTYTGRIYEGDPPFLVHTGARIAIVKDGLIIFDGDESYYRIECNFDPSQAFCAGN